MTGSYSGGSVNFFALRDHYQVREDLASSLIVADNFIMAGMFALLLAVPSFTVFRRRFSTPHLDEQESDPQQQSAATFWRRKEIALLDIAKAFAIALTIAAVSTKISDAVNQLTQPSEAGSISGPTAASLSPVAAEVARATLGNKYVLLTFFSVTVATLFSRQMENVRGCEEFGAYLLYIFFFVIGAPADLISVVQRVPVMFAFCLTIAAINLVVTLGLGRLLRLGLEELLISVNATLGGAPTAAGMAIAKGWSGLVLPALLVGIWGYVIGTPLGLMVHALLGDW
jgi:uncharacterized membrane protein